MNALPKEVQQRESEGRKADPIDPNVSVAIVLNRNARGVNNATIKKVQALLTNEKLFVSHSLEESKAISRQIVDQRFDVVLCGGGDGTFMHCITDIMELSAKKPPAFGILRLGTGNAMAETLKAHGKSTSGLAQDLRAARYPESRMELPLLESEGRYAPFMGLGFDSMILDDYNRIKTQLHGKRIAPYLEGPLGYTVAIGSRTLWRSLKNPLPEVIIRNEGPVAHRIDVAGRVIGRPFYQGEVLYRGPVSMAAASTIPHLGMKLKMFPQVAQRKDRFQLRIGLINPLKVLVNMPALFRGEFEDEGIWDFRCSAISISATEEVPIQMGGDLMGRRKDVLIRLAQLQAVQGADDPSSIRSKWLEALNVGRRTAALNTI